MLIAFIMLTDDVCCYVRALCDYVIHGYCASKKRSTILKGCKNISPENFETIYNLKSSKRNEVKSIAGYWVQEKLISVRINFSITWCLRRCHFVLF